MTDLTTLDDDQLRDLEERTHAAYLRVRDAAGSWAQATSDAWDEYTAVADEARRRHARRDGFTDLDKWRAWLPLENERRRNLNAWEV